ncbi:unnamed protein product [marine sediment metagenome]|uniref:Uncharacterized protein n=1 Tax=marine sediment metagenome TaxID=412755 RepID=X1UVC4_9ZZZZ
MPKKSSIITVAAQGNGYSVDARGAFGGGWTRHVTLAELSGAITTAWQQYGSIALFNNSLTLRVYIQPMALLWPV